MKKLFLVITVLIFINTVSGQVIPLKSSTELVNSANEKLAFYKKCAIIRPELMVVPMDTSITGIISEYEYSISDSSILMTWQKRFYDNKLVQLEVAVARGGYMKITKNNTNVDHRYITALLIDIFREKYLNKRN